MDVTPLQTNLTKKKGHPANKVLILGCINGGVVRRADLVGGEGDHKTGADDGRALED